MSLRLRIAFTLITCFILASSLLATSSIYKRWSDRHVDQEDIRVVEEYQNLANFPLVIVDEASLRIELARTYVDAKQFSEALVLLRQSIEATKTDMPRQQYKLRLEYAKVLAWADRTDEALREFSIVPPSEYAKDDVFTKMDVLVKHKRYTELLELLLESQKYFDSDLTYQLRLGEVYSWKKEYRKAIKIYESLLDQNPANIQVRRLLARVLAWDGQHGRSASEMAKTLNTP